MTSLCIFYLKKLEWSICGQPSANQATLYTKAIRYTSNDAIDIFTNKESNHLIEYVRKEHPSASMVKLNVKIPHL